MELKLLSQLCEEPLTSFKDFLKIFFKNPGERGEGKPEVLKRKYKDHTCEFHKVCMSRRLDDKNRLIYKVLGPRQILLIAFVGHYKRK